MWGLRARSTAISNFLNDMFNHHHIIGIRPCPLFPTWTNKQAGYMYIGKILDHAMVKDTLLDSLGVPRSSVLLSDISDHMLILLTWNIGDVCKGGPYKFNRA